VTCGNCVRGITLVSYPAEYVTKDMATDAGDKRLEGQIYSTEEKYEVCCCCSGDWENCEICKQEATANHA
jgi:hypothetical protein